jgi:hypothetical protein
MFEFFKYATDEQILKVINKHSKTLQVLEMCLYMKSQIGNTREELSDIKDIALGILQPSHEKAWDELKEFHVSLYTYTIRQVKSAQADADKAYDDVLKHYDEHMLEYSSIYGKSFKRAEMIEAKANGWTPP